MRLIDMFTPRGTSAYALASNFAYQASYPAGYNEICSDTAGNHLSNVENVANGNYQQNLSCSWPTVYAVSNSSATRQQVLYDDWVSINSNPCSYQAQPISYNSYHVQRNAADIAPTNFSTHAADGVSGSQTDGHPSPESAVAVSSDGLSGSESPELSLHLNSSGGTVICRPQPARSPFEWMKRTSYLSQPNPGKTRTKDKYRVVYTDHQRLELEKEFHYSRYITIRRKSELAGLLGLSERQVKIWFQNRRAKERKQAKKREEIEQKNKDVILQQTNAINISSLNFLRPIPHFDHDNNNSRNIGMFQNTDHVCK